MAKKLSIITAGGNLPFANNGLKLSENILIEKIEEHEKFKSLFSIDKALLDRIASDMEKNSFDSSQPVHIWVTKDDGGTEHNYLIDGYTRVAASKIAGIKMIPYFKHTFETFEEAHRYALHLQTDRRNLSGIDLLKNIRELMGSNYIQSIEGNKNEAIGKELGVSEKTVERANKVNSMASNEQIERIESGEDFCDIRISGSEKKEKTAAFISALENLDERYIKYGRRKEERIEIGKRNSARFGLSSPEQTVFVNGIKMQQPCAVVDASIHGICIIAPCSDHRMKDCDSFNVMLNFVSPEQTIVLKCHKVHAQLKKTESKIYARISCQLLEPIHFAWKERVIKLLESEKNL